MTSISRSARSAAATLVVAVIGLGAVAPAAYAQMPTPPSAQGPDAPHQFAKGDRRAPWHPQMRHQGVQTNGPEHMRGRNLMGVLEFARSAEALEIAFVRLAYAIEMTPEQQALFETLRADALAAQEAFAAITVELRPDASTPMMPELADLLDNRIAMDTARLEALTAVQPAFEAFFGSLTDEQKAELMPRRAMRMPGPDAQAPMAPPTPGTPVETAPLEN